MTYVKGRTGRERLFGRTHAGRHCHTAVIIRRLAVFSLLAVTTLAEAVKPKYAGIFPVVMKTYGGNALAVCSFSFSGGYDFGGSGKQKRDIFSTSMHYGVNFWQ